MADNNNQQINESLQAIARRRAILREGISEAALEVIKTQFHCHLPVFLLRDELGRPITDNPQMLALLSARRDGMLHVIKWIEQEIKQQPFN